MAAHTKDTMHATEDDEDYEEERATEYRAILDEEDKLLHYSSWKRNAPSIDRTVPTSIDTHPHQTSRKRASTGMASYPSIDTGVDHVREGGYSISSWADDHHHESYAVETSIHEPGADKIHEGFTYEELINMQRRDEEEQHRAEASGTRFSHPIDRANCGNQNSHCRFSVKLGKIETLNFKKVPDFLRKHTKYERGKAN